MGRVFDAALDRHNDELKTRLEALRSTLQLTDRVLTQNSKVTLKFVKGTLRSKQCPAMSVGPDIMIDIDQVPNPHTKSGLVHILGLNYHEVGHVRYGIDRRAISQWLREAAHPRFDEAYEILEEGRIETLLSTRYEKLKKYFTYPVVEYFVNEPAAWELAFLYTHGRKYLPRKIRDTFRAKFEDKYGKDNAAKFAALINQYRVLSFNDPKNVSLAARLINQFARLLQKADVPHNQPHDQQHQTGAMQSGTGQDSDSDAEEAKRQTKQQEKEEKEGKDGSGFREQQEEEPEEDEENGEEDAEEDDSEGGDESSASPEGSDEDPSEDSADEDGSDSEEGESDGSGSGEDSEDDEEAQSSERDSEDLDDDEDPDEDSDGGGGSGGGASDEADGEDSSANGAGTGTGRDSDFELDSQELAEELSGALSEILDNEDVQSDVEQLQEAMADQAGLNSTLERKLHSKSPVTPEMVLQSERLAGELRQMWAQMEPGWEYGLSEGNRIDMNRAAVIQDVEDYESIYVDWSEGQQDNAGLCVVIKVDKSSSMDAPVYVDGKRLGTRAEVASRNLWEIKHALEEVEATVTVLEFDGDSYTVYDTEEMVSTSEYTRIHPSGGTNPYAALLEARRILSMTDMPNKLLVSITDGEWWGSYEEILATLSGTVKVAILIGGTPFAYADKFDVTAKTSGDVFEPMAQAVVKIIERSMNR